MCPGAVMSGVCYQPRTAAARSLPLAVQIALHCVKADAERPPPPPYRDPNEALRPVLQADDYGPGVSSPHNRPASLLAPGYRLPATDY
jgi:hypothetical protein